MNSELYDNYLRKGNECIELFHTNFKNIFKICAEYQAKE